MALIELATADGAVECLVDAYVHALAIDGGGGADD